MDAYAPILPRYFVLRDAKDEKRLKDLVFHINTGDYFASVATVMGFLQETIETCSTTRTPMQNLQLKALDELKKNLAHLQNNYRIEKK